MRSGLHGAPTKPVPGRSCQYQASNRRRDAECVCISDGEQVTRQVPAGWRGLPPTRPEGPNPYTQVLAGEPLKARVRSASAAPLGWKSH